MVTAYDFPSAVHVARAGIDVVLMGDSLAMVELGFATTQPIDVDPMIWHCASVKRGIDYAASTATTADFASPLLVGDMPFGSYEFEDSDIALRNAYRFVKEAGVDAVKLEVRTTRRSCTRRLNRCTLCLLLFAFLAHS
jgi:3-methyl-2-oxobutanoate hydroxymethyltransferase